MGKESEGQRRKAKGSHERRTIRRLVAQGIICLFRVRTRTLQELQIQMVAVAVAVTNHGCELSTD
jgi:hypothetical protein